MKDVEFWELYDSFMSAPLTYQQKQVFYLAAKARYSGARLEDTQPSIVHRFKRWAHLERKQNGYKGGS